MTPCVNRPHPPFTAYITRAIVAHDGARRDARAVPYHGPGRSTFGLENSPVYEREIVSESAPTRDPDDPSFIVSNRLLVDPEARTGSGVFRYSECSGIEHWSKSSFRPVVPTRYETTIPNERLLECTHPSILESEACIRAPGTAPVDDPDACHSIRKKSNRSFWTNIGHNQAVSRQHVALIDDDLRFFKCDICYCMTERMSIFCAHVQAINIISEAPASGGMAGRCLAGA